MVTSGGGLVARLWRRTVRKRACYVWVGACSAPKRRRVRVQQFRPGPRPIIKVNGLVEYVYRVAFRLFVGPIPDGHDIHHTCNEPWSSRCWNPAHLQAVEAPVNRYGIKTRNTRGWWQ